jgi:hypothetical protein
MQVTYGCNAVGSNIYEATFVQFVREEFQHDNYECSTSLLRAIWNTYLSDITNANAPRIIVSLQGYARATCLVFREILRQAQFSGYTTVNFITNANEENSRMITWIQVQ